MEELDAFNKFCDEYQSKGPRSHGEINSLGFECFREGARVERKKVQALLEHLAWVRKKLCESPSKPDWDIIEAIDVAMKNTVRPKK